MKREERKPQEEQVEETDKNEGIIDRDITQNVCNMWYDVYYSKFDL